MPGGDIIFKQASQLHKDVLSDLGDTWKDMSENDKQLLDRILKDAALVVSEAITQPADWYTREQAHLKAQFLGLSAQVAAKVEKVVLNRIGNILAMVAKSFLTGLLV